MSGHSKWETTRRQKSVNDSKRAKSFTKVLKNIVSVVKRGGGNVDANFLLKLAIDRAKEANVPSSSIESAISKGLGTNVDGKVFEEVFYEALGPKGVSILIQCFTDNRTRLISELRVAVERNGGRMLDNGSISWQFELQYIFYLQIGSSQDSISLSWNKENKRKVVDVEAFELSLMDIPGVLDFSLSKDALEIFVNPGYYNDFKNYLDSENYDILDIEVSYIPKVKLEINDTEGDNLLDFISKIEDIDEVKDVYINV